MMGQFGPISAVARALTEPPDSGSVRVTRPAADPAHTRVGTPQGDGVAKRRWCEDGAGIPPANNEIAAPRRRGPHRITIINQGDRWAAVKMRNESHRTVLAIFVASQSTAEVKDFPSAHFRLEFALGTRWSRRCGVFLDNMEAQRFPEFNEFPAPPARAQRYQVVHARYVITPVLDGNVQAEAIPANDFAAQE